jgi:hypothetical protein
MKINKIHLAALAAIFIVPGAALADDSISNLEMQTKSDRQPARNYSYQTTSVRTAVKGNRSGRSDRPATIAVYTEHRGLGESQPVRHLEHIPTGNGGDISVDVPAN